MQVYEEHPAPDLIKLNQDSSLQYFVVTQELRRRKMAGNLKQLQMLVKANVDLLLFPMDS